MPETIAAIPWLSDLRAALASGDLDLADRLLAESAASQESAALPLIAEVHLRRQRWDRAAATIDRIASPDLPLRLKRNTARNFASLQQHRPDDYRRLLAAQPSTRYRLAPIEGDRLTIADCRDPARPLILTPGRDPVAAVQRALKDLEPAMREGGAIGLGGIGDGHLLAVLGRIQPKLFMDMQQAVWLFEPDLSLLLICFMLHDYSGSQGPIEQPRFLWFIGDDWADRFRHAMLADPMLPPPLMVTTHSIDPQIMPRIQEALAAITLAAETAAERVKARCERMDAGELADLFLGRGPRKPRVMFLTTRFSTVLQYATRDAAAGFEEIGWDAHIAIEPTSHHCNSPAAIRMAMAAFEPDLVFQIDHLRHEHGDIFPPQLPFACWIQDHLPVLTNTKAGQLVASRDFVLTFSSPLFTDTYAYPARQCIDMPMMLTSPRRWEGSDLVEAPDLIYVSNVSHDPETLLPNMLLRTDARWHPLLNECAIRLKQLYVSGRSYCSRYELREMLDNTNRAMGGPPLDAATAGQIVEVLWNPLNIALYRQQALGWAADAADQLGLSLGVYGQGWDRHPQFGRFAKGVVQNGKSLASLMRSARINLNLEPYICYTHQRLLDGLSAGGFFLVRHIEGNFLLQELANLLESHFDSDVQSAAHALQAARGDIRQRLDVLLTAAACATFGDEADPVRQVRSMQRAGVLICQRDPLPRLRETSFSTSSECRFRIGQFMANPSARADILAAQRQSIAHLGFAQGMQRVVRRVAELLQSESNATAAQSIHVSPRVAHAA